MLAAGPEFIIARSPLLRRVERLAMDICLLIKPLETLKSYRTLNRFLNRDKVKAELTLTNDLLNKSLQRFEARR